MTDTERKEVEELGLFMYQRYVIPNFGFQNYKDLASILVREGYTKRPQENNLVPLDELELCRHLDRLNVKGTTQYIEKIAESICLKFGKDNNGMVALDKNEVMNYLRDFYTLDNRDFEIIIAICSFFGRHTPKERKVSLKKAYEIFMEGCFFGKGENVSSDATVIFTQRSTLDEEGIKERLTAILSLLNATEEQ